MSVASKPVEVFYSYAPEDKRWLKRLDIHLSLLKRQRLISAWHDRLLVPGTDWAQETDTHLNSASVILLLISPDFLASDYCYGIEMQRALERDQAKEARVIPILLRPVDWKGAPFAHLQALPTESKPITTWANKDTAFADVAAGIRRAIEDLASISDKTEPTESSSLSIKPSTSIPLPSMRRNLSRKTRWLLAIIFTSVILLGIVGNIAIFTLWHPNPTPSVTTTAVCMAAPTLTGPPDGQTLNSRTVTLTWEAPQGCLPDGYTVRINADYDPEAKPWIVDTGWAPTDYTYTFSADGTYYWHIRACQPCTPFHPGNWAIRSFAIHA